MPAGIVWAITYALLIEPRLHGPDWLKGTAFSIVPTAISWLVILPLVGAGPLGFWLDVGLVLAVGELVRHAVYGAALGIAYPVLLLARPPADARPLMRPTVPLPAD